MAADGVFKLKERCADMQEEIWMNKDEKKAMLSLNGNPSEETLKRIVDESPHKQVRAEAAKKITDLKYLEGVAEKHKDTNIRYIAVMRINDQDVLRRISQNEADWGVRNAAVKKLTDETLIEKIAVSDPDRYVRLSAVEKLKNQELIASIAVSDAEDIVRRGAAKKISDPEKHQMTGAEVERLGCIAICPKCRQSVILRPESAPVCPMCNSKLLMSDIPVPVWQAYARDGANGNFEQQETINSLIADTDELVGKISDEKRSNSQRGRAMILLSRKPERNHFLTMIAPYLKDPNLVGCAAEYMSRCGAAALPFLSLDIYRICIESRYPRKKLNQLLWPIFAEYYSKGKAAPCEICGGETHNLILKIEPTKTLVSEKYKGSGLVQTYEYGGESAPHIICDACALKNAAHGLRARRRSDAENIHDYLFSNNDGIMLSFNRLLGFNYEYLVSTEAQIMLASNPENNQMLAGMIKHAYTVKADLDKR